MTSHPNQPFHREEECDNVELYAAGAMNAADNKRFREHLDACPACQADLKELQELMQLLPLTVDPVEPPAGMKQRILGAVLGQETSAESVERKSNVVGMNSRANLAAEEGISPDAAAAVPAAELGSRAWTSREQRQASGTARTSSVESRRPRLTALLAGAAAVMLLVCGVLAQRMDSLGKRNDQLAAELQQVRSSLASAESELSTVMSPSADAAVSQIVSLKPVKNMVAKGQAYIVVDAKGTHLIVQASKLPSLKDNQAFQVWLLKGDKPVNAGTFKSVNGSGAITFTFKPDSFDQIAITLEPDAFGTQPRGTMVMAGGLKV